jgi:transposase
MEALGQRNGMETTAMSYCDSPPMDRKQALLFCPTLDAMIPQDHPVRVVDEILSQFDWRAWEARYNGQIGRPPIPPKVLASVILYGMSVGLRSSRRLEEACLVRMDFIWLASGRPIDHSTFCEFRRAFRQELKETFRQIGRVAMALGLMRLNRIGLDGTRERANSSRHGTATAKTLAERLAVLDDQIETAFAEAEVADGRDGELFGCATPNKLPRKLADLKRRQEQLHKALAKARAMDAKRGIKDEPTGRKSQGAEGDGRPALAGKEKKKPRPAKVPAADPDAAVMPNKDGGHAPNYTPLLAVDGERGYIADAEVDNRPTEGQATVATVERIEAAFGQKPREVLGDGAYADGQQLAELEAREVEVYVPVKTAGGDDPENPAIREDPAQPVPEASWDRLPRSTQGKTRSTLDRAAFVYNEEEDVLYCPMGRALPLKDTQQRTRADGRVVTVRRYECVGCERCPLSESCRQGTTARRVQIDEYEAVRQRVQARMNSPAGQEVYASRWWICETPFAFIKSWMNFRQFLLRGLEKVKTEWLWACTAYNLRKLVGDVQRMRVKFATIAE